MHLLDGKRLAEGIRAELQETRVQRQVTPTLAVMIVGDDPASHLYVNMKKRVGETLGLDIQIHSFPADIAQETLLAQIEAWNQNPQIHGILVQVPLPVGHDESAIIQAMDPKKDVDGFHPNNILALEEGTPYLLSPVHEGILRLINEAPVHINGAQASIIGNSPIFTTPLAHLLQTAGAITRIMSANELDHVWLKESQIVVIAIGRKYFLQPTDVRDDAVIIDVGTNRDDGHTVYGDVNLPAFEKTDCWITPVPGGVGPMTIALLMRNVMYCAEMQTGTPSST